MFESVKKEEIVVSGNNSTTNVAKTNSINVEKSTKPKDSKIKSFFANLFTLGIYGLAKKRKRKKEELLNSKTPKAEEKGTVEKVSKKEIKEAQIQNEEEQFENKATISSQILRAQRLKLESENKDKNKTESNEQSQLQ